MNKKRNSFTVLALALVFAFTVSCTGGIAGGGGKVINSATALKEYLDSQPANSADKPIKIKMSLNDQVFKDVSEAITASGKYVYLNLTGSPLTAIPDGAFLDEKNSSSFHLKGCATLVGVTIPHDVTSVGAGAFQGCESLASVTIPNGVTSIGKGAFKGCKSLASITIPDSVTSIDIDGDDFAGDYDFWGKAFDGTAWLESQPDGVVYAGKVAYTYKGDKSGLTSITLRDGTKVIGGYAFANCKNLTSITIPNSVTSIGKGAFSECTSLTSVTLGNRIESIGGGYKAGAFYNCESLTNITIPDSVTSIGQDAFDWCKNLTSVTIGSSVANISENHFDRCSSLTTINVSASNSTYTSENGVLYNKDKTTLILYPEGIKGAFIIPSSVTSIVEYAFEDCTGLTSLTIPNSVTSIGKYAFDSCRNLTSVTFQGTIPSSGLENFGSLNGSIGDLRSKYLAGGAGTYKTTASAINTSRWKKQ